MTSVDYNFNFLCGCPHGAGPPPPSTCVHLSLTPLDVINEWPLILIIKSDENVGGKIYITFVYSHALEQTLDSGYLRLLSSWGGGGFGLIGVNPAVIPLPENSIKLRYLLLNHYMLLKHLTEMFG